MKIIASAGITLPKNQLTKLVLAGTDIIRYNFSHYSLDENINYVLNARNEMAVIASNAKDMFELPHNRIRLGYFHKKFIYVNEGDELIIKSGTISTDKIDDSEFFIPVSIENFGEKVTSGQIIKLSNGNITIQISEIIDANAAKILILNSGRIEPFEMMSFNYTVPDEEMLQRYDEILKAIKDIAPNYLTLTYINKKFFNELRRLKSYQDIAKNTRIVLKICDELNDEELKELFIENGIYGFLLDRGMVAVNMPYELSGLYQKKVLNYSKHYHKPVMISTQILATTVNRFTPSKPEIADLTNLILEGAAGVVLSHHISHENRPAYAVSIAKKIIKAVKENEGKYLNTEI